jgi:TRAP-type transport system periplasmic protein
VTSYTKLGANVLVVPWGETYSALRQGTVESSCASIDQLYSTGFAEVCPYITWTKEYYTEVLMVANNDLWDKMSADQQRILTEAANEAGLVMEQEVAKSTRNDVERIEKEFNAEFITIDTTPLRDALIPYYYELESKGVIPAGVVDSILAQK